MSFVLRGNARQLRFTGEVRSLEADGDAAPSDPTLDDPAFDDLPTLAFRRPAIAPPAKSPAIAPPAPLPIPHFRRRAALSSPTVIIPRKRARAGRGGPLPLALWLAAAAVVAGLSFHIAPEVVVRYAPGIAR